MYLAMDPSARCYEEVMMLHILLVFSIGTAGCSLFSSFDGNMFKKVDYSFIIINIEFPYTLHP